MIVSLVQCVMLHVAVQGVDDLEEVLSERLQQLPAPTSRQNSGAAPAQPNVVIPDELPTEERSKVRLSQLKVTPLEREAVENEGLH